MQHDLHRAQGPAARLQLTLELDGAQCIWCGRTLAGLVPATREHLVPRVKGGPSWRENEVAACRRCNSQRGHQPVVAWLEECQRRGWSPDVSRIRRALQSLDDAIGERGGQRRARTYVESQLRRLAKRP